MKTLAINLFCLFALFAVAACQDAPPSTVVPQLTIGGVKEVGLDVARIEVVEKYASSMSPPYVEHLFQQPPAQIARRMVGEKLRPQGSLHTLRVVIEDASVVRRELPVREGFGGLFYDEPSESFKLRVVLRFELLAEHDRQSVIGNALVVSERERGLQESSSPADKDMMFFNMTEDLVRDLETGFQGVVRQTFGWK